MDAQLKIGYTDTSGKSKTKTISDVDPNATSAQYKQLAQGFVGLTTNTYGRTDLVKTINIDTEEALRPTPTLTTGDFTKSGSNIYYASIQYSGDGVVCAKVTSSGENIPYVRVSNESIYLSKNGTVSGSTVTVTLTSTGTVNYAPVTVTKSFTWEE